MSTARYRVTGPYVIAKTMTRDGLRMVGLGEGALVPDDASQEWLKHHLRMKLIEKVEQVEAVSPAPTRNEQPPAPPKEPDEPPASAPENVNYRSSKAELIAYGVARGDDRATLEEMTVKELQALYLKGDDQQ